MRERKREFLDRIDILEHKSNKVKNAYNIF